MKRTNLFVILIIAFTIFTFVSCSEFEDYLDKCYQEEQALKQKTETTTNTNLPEEENTTSDDDSTDENNQNIEDNSFYLLDFTEIATTRGMTAFPASTPFLTMENGGQTEWISSQQPSEDNIWLACKAMSTLPIIPSLKKYTNNPTLIISALTTKTTYGYGFPMKVKDWKVNKDGLYLKYVLYEGKKEIGVIEYYYSWASGTFSYRELVIPYLEKENPGFGDNILYFEMHDVAIKEDENGLHFTAGGDSAYYKFWQIGIYSQSEPNNRTVFIVQESDMLMNHQGGDVTSAGYKLKELYCWDKIDNALDPQTINPDLVTFFNNEENKIKYGYTFKAESSSTTGSVKAITLDNDKCDLDFTWEILKLLADTNTVETLRSSSNSIKNISDFNNRGLTFTNLMTAKENIYRVIESYDLYNPVMFNLNANKGSTLADKANSLGATNNDTFEEAVAHFKNAKTYKTIFDTADTPEKFMRIFFSRLGLNESTINTIYNSKNVWCPIKYFSNGTNGVRLGVDNFSATTGSCKLINICGITHDDSHGCCWYYDNENETLCIPIPDSNPVIKCCFYKNNACTEKVAQYGDFADLNCLYLKYNDGTEHILALSKQ